MGSHTSPPPSEIILGVFEQYSQALVQRTAVFLLRHYAVTMRDLHLDPQAVAFLEEEAQAVAQHLDRQDVWAFPPSIPALLEAYSQALVMHTAAFLLRHYAITMRGLHLEARAVAYLEKEIQAIEQQMDDQDAAFPDLFDTMVMEVMRALVTSGDSGVDRAEQHPPPAITLVTPP